MGTDFWIQESKYKSQSGTNYFYVKQEETRKIGLVNCISSILLSVSIFQILHSPSQAV